MLSAVLIAVLTTSAVALHEIPHHARGGSAWRTVLQRRQSGPGSEFYRGEDPVPQWFTQLLDHLVAREVRYCEGQLPKQ